MKRAAVVVLAAWLGACASTTVIRSNPSGARVFLDGAPVGQTPYEMSDSKISGSSTQVRLEYPGYAPIDTSITRTEHVAIGPLIAGVFFLIPLLWMLDYNPTHDFVMTPQGSGPAGPTPAFPNAAARPAPPMPRPPTATPDPNANPNVNTSDPEALNEDGKRLYKLRDFRGAAARFQQAIALSPQGRYYFNLCTALEEQGDHDGALTACAAVYVHDATGELRQKTDDKVKAIRAAKGK